MARLYPPQVSRGQAAVSPVSSRSAPPVGGLGGSHQHSAQFTQFGSTRAFVQRGGDILRGASHLVDAVGQVSSLIGRQHHRVGRQGCAFHTVDRGPLLVGALPTRLPAVLAATAQAAVGDVSTTPAARLRADTTSHEHDFSRGACRIPVSWTVGSCSPGNYVVRRSVVQDASC